MKKSSDAGLILLIISIIGGVVWCFSLIFKSLFSDHEKPIYYPIKEPVENLIEEEKQIIKSVQVKKPDKFNHLWKNEKFLEMAIEEDLRLMKAGDLRPYEERYIDIGNNILSFKNNYKDEYILAFIETEEFIEYVIGEELQYDYEYIYNFIWDGICYISEKNNISMDVAILINNYWCDFMNDSPKYLRKIKRYIKTYT
jgi:hypothetical protein